MAGDPGRIGPFLQRCGWQDAARVAMVGDASTRRYERLTDSAGRTTILMDAPPQTAETVHRFVAIANHLRDIGLSAPKILSQSPDQGLLLLEDLGDDLFTKVLSTSPARQTELYDGATDVITHLHRIPPPSDLPIFSPEEMADLTAPAWSWYLSQSDAVNTDLHSRFTDLFLPLAKTYFGDDRYIMLRDYHAENLIWLPQRSGLAQVGLLDFQDAHLGPRPYDLVSMLQDCRRDVSPEIEAHQKQRFIDAHGLDRDPFDVAYALVGMQRSLRIVGLFVRLCLRDGKPGYLSYLPRCWDMLHRNLRNPALSEIASLIETTLTPPSQSFIEELRSQCPKI